MWLFTTRGFLSIVENKDDPDLLHVRARCKEDIEKFAELVKGIGPFNDPLHPAENIQIERTEYGDYLYRFDAPRDAVVAAVNSLVHEINYTNFKASTEDHSKEREKAYFKVWAAMQELQEEKDG